jgi:hypothetical protein
MDPNLLFKGKDHLHLALTEKTDLLIQIKRSTFFVAKIYIAIQLFSTFSHFLISKN